MARLRITPAQAWRDFLYVGVALPLGIFWLIALGLGLALGVGLAVLTIGIPILAVTMLLWKAGYALTASAGRGDVRAGAIRTDPESRRSLELRSSAGDVTAEVQTRR
jgi:hypothetical protein